MSKDVSDLLEVLLLVQEVGFYDLVIGVSSIQVVFLFEIVEDLRDVFWVMYNLFELFLYCVVFVGGYDKLLKEFIKFELEIFYL